MSILSGLFKKRARGFRQKSLSASQVNQIRRFWQKVESLSAVSSPSSLRQAVVEADKVVDTALGFLVPGETMGERLKNARDLFKDYSDYQKVWDAHKVRNALVHEAGYEPPYYVSQKALDKFKHGLKSLGVKL